MIKDLATHILLRLVDLFWEPAYWIPRCLSRERMIGSCTGFFNEFVSKKMQLLLLLSFLVVLKELMREKYY